MLDGRRELEEWFSEGKLKQTGGKIYVFAMLKHPTRFVVLKRRDGFLLHLIVIDVRQHDWRGEREANPHILCKALRVRWRKYLLMV